MLGPEEEVAGGIEWMPPLWILHPGALQRVIPNALSLTDQAGRWLHRTFAIASTTFSILYYLKTGVQIMIN